MKKIAVIIIFCSTTFSMGMKESADDVSSKLKTMCKKFHEKFDPYRESDNFLYKLFFSSIVLEKIVDKNFKNSFFYKKLYADTDWIPDVEEFFADLDFVSSNPINNKDYENLDASLKFVSSQSESIYKELQEKKKKYSKLNPPKGYFRYYGSIRNFGAIAISWSLTFVANLLCTKIFGEIKTKGDLIKRFLLLSGITIINTKGCNKIFHPYTRRCKIYEEKKKEKEDYEYMKNFALCMRDRAIRRSPSKPIFRNSIREKENDKLRLLDVEIKTCL